MIFQYDSANIHYQLKGEGPCLIMLHGFLEDHRIWDRIAAKLAKRFTLLLPDLPGHGKSDTLGEVQSMTDLAGAVHALSTHLNFESYQLLGHSMGGYVCLALMDMDPVAVHRIILLNSTSEADSATRKANRNKGIELLGKNPNTFISSLIRQLFDPETVRLYEAEIAQLVSRATEFPVEGIAACMRGMRDRPDRTSSLSSFNRDKLLISATKDPIMDPFQIQRLANSTNSELHFLSGGHMSWLESPAEIVKIV